MLILDCANELIRSKLTAARRAHGFSRLELAEKLSLTAENVEQAEIKPINIPINVLYRIICYFELESELTLLLSLSIRENAEA